MRASEALQYRHLPKPPAALPRAVRRRRARRPSMMPLALKTRRVKRSCRAVRASETL